MKPKCRRLILRIVILAVFPMVLGVPGSRSLLAAADELTSSDASATPSEASRVVGAANAFLATLDEKQRAKVLFAFSDDKQRARWSNFPTGFVPRGGLSLRELNDAQRAAVMTLVSSALSPKGFTKVQQIMEADDVFKATNHGPPPFDKDKEGGQNRPPFDPGQDGRPGGPPPGDAKDGQHGPPPLGADLFGKDLYYVSILGTPSEKARGCCSSAATTWP